MTQANPHPTPIRLEDYGFIRSDTTLHEMLAYAIDVAAVLGRDGVLPEEPSTAWPDRISYSLADQLSRWVRDAKPACGARDQEPGSKPSEFYECELDAFHGGDHQDANATWPA